MFDIEHKGSVRCEWNLFFRRFAVINQDVEEQSWLSYGAVSTEMEHLAPRVETCEKGTYMQYGQPRHREGCRKKAE